MGLDRDSLAFLIACSRRLGVAFDDTLTLGRQAMLVDVAYLRSAYAQNGLRPSSAELTEALDGWAEPFLRSLGARRIDSIDASDFEGCTIQHDLNQRLPSELRGRYSAVLDGGTLEHVFDYPTALRNTLEAVSVGGHAILMTPGAGYTGHGFYQLSPELFYRVLAPANGFEVRSMLLKAQRWGARWYAVPDPAVVGTRIVWRGAWPTMLYVIARRIEDRPILAEPPMQSDYVARWEGTWKRKGRRARTIGALRPHAPLALREMSRSAKTWRSAASRLRHMSLTELVDAASTRTDSDAA